MTSPDSAHPAALALQAVIKNDLSALESVLAQSPAWSALWAPAVSVAVTTQNDPAWQMLRSAFKDQPSLWTLAAGDVLILIQEHSFGDRAGQPKLSAPLMLKWLSDISTRTKSPAIRMHLLECHLQLSRPHQALAIVHSWPPQDRQAVWRASGKTLPNAFKCMKGVERMSARQQKAATDLLDLWGKEAPLSMLVSLLQKTVISPFENFMVVFMPDRGTQSMNTLAIKHLKDRPLTSGQSAELDAPGSPGRTQAISLCQGAVKEGRQDLLECIWNNWFQSGARQPHDTLMARWLAVEAANLLAAEKPPISPEDIKATTEWVWSNIPKDSLSAAVLTLWSDEEWDALDAMVVAGVVDPSLVTTLDLPEDASEKCPHLVALRSNIQLSDYAHPSASHRPARKI